MCVAPTSARSGRRRLRSADYAKFDVPRTKTEFGKRAFAVSGPSMWNTLPISIRSAPTIGLFKTALKTHLFKICYHLPNYYGLTNLNHFGVCAILYNTLLRYFIQNTADWHHLLSFSVQNPWYGLPFTALNKLSLVIKIDLEPISHTCVYSTLKFITSEAFRLNMEAPIVTFDQCLWIKATEVICAKSG